MNKYREFDIEYPESAEKVNWGAALLTPFWAIKHKKFIVAILAIIPGICFVTSLVALIYGGRWAWDSREWETDYFFKESLMKWNVAGISAFIIIWLILFIMALD